MRLLDIRTSHGLRLSGSSGHAFVVKDGGFSGWDDGSTMRSATAPRPQAHGDFDMPGLLAGRLVELSGWALADNAYELENLRDGFIGHGAAGTKFRVTVEHNGRSLWGDARIAAGTVPTFKDLGGRNTADWSVSWWFPDPRKYRSSDHPQGSPFGPATSVKVFHSGNFPALPVLTVTGSSPGGYTITGPNGRRIIVTTPLVSGAPHVFDMSTGWLTVGGVRVLGGVARAELFTIPPGLPETTVSVSVGQITVDVLDTFI